MTSENTASSVTKHAGLTPENAELLGKYAPVTSSARR